MPSTLAYICEGGVPQNNARWPIEGGHRQVDELVGILTTTKTETWLKL